MSENQHIKHPLWPIAAYSHLGSLVKLAYIYTILFSSDLLISPLKGDKRFKEIPAKKA